MPTRETNWTDHGQGMYQERIVIQKQNIFCSGITLIFTESPRLLLRQIELNFIGTLLSPTKHQTN